jgi:hypothetical protein
MVLQSVVPAGESQRNSSPISRINRDPRGRRNPLRPAQVRPADSKRNVEVEVESQTRGRGRKGLTFVL